MTFSRLKWIRAALLIFAIVSGSLAEAKTTSLVCKAIVGTASSLSQTLAKPVAAKPSKVIDHKAKTKAEAEIGSIAPQLSADDQLLKEIDDLKAENSTLASDVKSAREAKKARHSLRLDLSHLQTPMVNFLHGTYAKVLGDRGLSRPFVTFRADGDALVIQQAGDKFAMMVRWNEDLEVPKLATVEQINGVSYQVLELPAAMKGEAELRQLPEKFIFSLISGSSLNRYIPSGKSRVARMTSLLHDGRLVFDRPTQVESKQVTELLDADPALRSKVHSLLFVAPTASGKTRVLGDKIVSRVKGSLAQGAGAHPKLTVLLTKTPDLTSELAKNIGSQVMTEVGARNVRVIQWGGELSEEHTLKEVLAMVDASPVPVILVSSYPTIGTRTNSAADKAELFQRANGLMIDEAHNATGNVFRETMKAALESQVGRGADARNALDIFGVTASPITREQRTVEVFDRAFWAGLDKPNTWAQKIKNGKAPSSAISVLDWVRVLKQYNIARDRGEIAAGDAMFYKPEERGFEFSSIFKPPTKGNTAPSINIEKLKTIWPDVEKMIADHGPGVIQTYPRDAGPIAEALSALTGKNYVSLQKLNPSARYEVYTAFRDQTAYQGRKIDAIVGSIREGLDFPQAGWYLSFKKYVRFPENVQGPGRVVRLALDKPSPVILFFGVEVNKIAYERVRELVMSRLGKLPRQLNEPRFFSGARRGDPAQRMTLAIENTNAALEALLRIRGDLTKDLGAKGAFNVDKVKELQSVLRDMRLNDTQNREIRLALQQLSAELYSYPFFTGDLASTWEYCDKLLAQAKKPAGSALPRGFGETETQILNSPEVMDQVKQFRALYSQIGSLPRLIVSNMSLAPVNVHEIADAVNAFVARNGVAPTGDFARKTPASLKTLMDLAIGTSPDGVWRSLDAKAREKLSGVIRVDSQISLEKSLQLYFDTYGTLPRPGYDFIDDNNVTAADRLGARLLEELEARLHDGNVEISEMQPNLIAQLDRSAVFNDAVVEAIGSIIDLQADLSTASSYVAGLHSQGLLTFENLMQSGEFKILKVVKRIEDASKAGSTNASLLHQAAVDELGKIEP